MFKKVLLILLAAVLITLAVVWGMRFNRAKSPISLYKTLSGKKSIAPQTDAAVPVEIPEVEAAITGATIFQSGVAAVSRCANPGAVARFRVSGDLKPLAGSIAFSPGVKDVKKITLCEEKVLYYPAANLTKTFAGRLVTLRVVDGAGGSEISGTVIDPEPEKGAASAENFVILKLANSRRTMIRRDLIQRVDAEQVVPVISGVRRVPRECWLFTAEKMFSGPVGFQYLTRGLKWRSFLVLTLAGDRMNAELNGEIVNHLDKLDDVPVVLASGNPQFAGDADPMALANFYRRKSVQEDGSEIMMCAKSNTSDLAMGRVASGTQNIRCFPVGKVSLKTGEVLIRKLGTVQGSCERLAVWRSTPHQKGKAVESVRFVNPFAFPIPAGTVLVSDLGSAPFAQVEGKWLNVGEKMTIDLLDAPSIIVKREDREISSEFKERKILDGVSRSYRLYTAECVLTVRNYQSKPVKTVAEAEFTGKVLAADGNPRSSEMLNGDDWNPLGKLEWEFPLAPGEEKKITFRYQKQLQR